MKMPGFTAETSLYQPALIVRPDPGGFEGPVVIGDPGGFGGSDLPPQEISSDCVKNCQDTCSDLCLLRPNPVKCFINRCIPNCRKGCVGT
jgi:hypothetical protein